MSTLIDTAKEREWLKRLPLTISEMRHSHACDGGYSVVGGAAATAIARELTHRFDALLDALDAERTRAEKAEVERAQALARLAVAYEAADDVLREHLFHKEHWARRDIRALTPADAQAALDKMLAEAQRLGAVGAAVGCLRSCRPQRRAGR